MDTDDDQPSKILNDFRKIQSKLQIFSFFVHFPTAVVPKLAVQLPIPKENIDFMTISIDNFCMLSQNFTVPFQILVDGAEGPYLVNGQKSLIVASICPDPNSQLFSRFDYQGDYQVRFQPPKQGYLNIQLGRYFFDLTTQPLPSNAIFESNLSYSIYYYYK